MISEFIKRSITAVLLSICFGGAYLHSTTLFSILMLIVFILIATFEWPKLTGLRGIKLIALSFVYPGLPIAGLLYLNYCYRSVNLLLPLYPLFIAWMADTCGYMIGKSFGKHKVCPAISPGKSWEGLSASFGGVILLNYFLLPYLKVAAFIWVAKDFKVVVIISLIQTIVAFLGGIFISYLKRKKGLKDAGSVLPGHGGLLDRFDSVFATVFVIYGMLFFHIALRGHGISVGSSIQSKFSYFFSKVKNLVPLKATKKAEKRTKRSMPLKKKEKVIPGQVVPGQSDDSSD